MNNIKTTLLGRQIKIGADVWTIVSILIIDGIPKLQIASTGKLNVISAEYVDGNYAELLPPVDSQGLVSSISDVFNHFGARYRADSSLEDNNARLQTAVEKEIANGTYVRILPQVVELGAVVKELNVLTPPKYLVLPCTSVQIDEALMEIESNVDDVWDQKREEHENEE